MTTSDREEAGGPRASQRPTGLTGFDLMRAQLGCALGPQTPDKHVLYECRNSLNVLLFLPSSVRQRSQFRNCSKNVTYSLQGVGLFRCYAGPLVGSGMGRYWASS